MIVTVLTYLINYTCNFFNQVYYYLYDAVDKIEVSPYFVLGYIIFNEVVGLTSITIDFILEDVIRPKKRIKITKYEDF